MAIDDRCCCEHCGRPLNPSPYLMALRSERALMSWPWALVLLTALLVACLLVGRAM